MRDARIIIMAAGEAKAKMVYEAVMKPKHRDRPASILQGLSGSRFYLTQVLIFHFFKIKFITLPSQIQTTQTLLKTFSKSEIFLWVSQFTS
jgi:hypothetical protein